jgi:hypothetical protein
MRDLLVVTLAAVALSGCEGTTSIGAAKPPMPGGPRIANLQFNPERIRAGESTTMSFYFEVATADVQEGFLLERGIEQFQLYTSLRQTPLDLRAYSGQVAALVSTPLSWSQPGIRFLEVYVVTKTGAESNRLVGRITVD